MKPFLLTAVFLSFLSIDAFAQSLAKGVYIKSVDVVRPGVVTQILANEIERCGLASGGTACLESRFIRGADLYQRVNSWEAYINYPQYRVRDPSEAHRDYQFFILKQKKAGKWVVNVYRNLKPLPWEKALKELVRGKIPVAIKIELYSNLEEAVAGHQQRIRETEDIQELYHSAAFLLNNGRRLDSDFTKAVAQNEAKILENDSDTYQIAFLKLLAGKPNLEKTFNQLADGLLNCGKVETERKVAIQLANLGDKRARVYTLLEEAIQSKSGPRYDRAEALSALSQIKRIPGDEILILSSIGDGDYTVSQKATELAKKMEVGPDHYDALEKIVSSGEESQKQTALELMAQIPTPQALSRIIEALGDEGYYVHQKAKKLLDSKTLSNSNIPDLKPLLSKSQEQNVRLAAIDLLKKINTPESFAELIPLVASEDYYTHQAALKALEPYAHAGRLRKEDVPSLIQLLSAKESSYVQAGLKLLAEVNDPKALHAIIGQLSHDDYYVYERARKILEKKRLTEREIDPLSKALNRVKEDSPKKAILRLLGSIGTSAALEKVVPYLGDDDYYTQETAKNVLKKASAENLRRIPFSHFEALNLKEDSAARFTIEVVQRISNSEAASLFFLNLVGHSDYSIRDKAVKALRGKKYTDQAPSILRRHLASDDSSLRKDAIEAAAHLPSKEVLQVLRDHLEDEDDYSVSDALKRVIRQMKRQVGS